MNLSEISRLSQEVRLSTSTVNGQLNSIRGLLTLWLDRQWGGIRPWAETHILLTKQLERVVYTIKAEEVSQEVKETLEQGREALQQLALRIDSSRLVDCLKRELPCVNDNPNLFRFDGSRRSLCPYQTEWHLNLGLLMPIYLRSQDDNLKKQIRFLVLNYLYKAAPICPNDVIMEGRALDSLLAKLQLSAWNPGLSYNRESNVFESYFEKEISATFAPASGKRFFIVDTLSLEDLFALHFSYFNSLEKLNDFLQGFDQVPEDLTTPINPSLLIDCTHFLEPTIVTLGEDGKNALFNEKFHHLETALEQLIHQATSGKSERLKIWLKLNMTFICRCEVNHIPLIKILPLFHTQMSKCSDQIGDHFSMLDLIQERALGHLNRFLSHTGMRMGSVTGRKLLAHSMSLEKLVETCHGRLTHYTGYGENALYIKNKLELTERTLFTRLRELFQKSDGFLSALGKPTLELLEGLLKEISEEQWKQENGDLDKRELIQNSLRRIFIHLGMCDLHRSNFNQFVHYMELIHYEILVLLTLFEPFKKANFSTLYQQRLGKTIPEALKDHFKGGLSKTAMNTFAGIQAALGPKCQALFTNGIHFEFIELLGANRNFEQVQKEGRLSEVDLYLGEFNHNISLYAHPTPYTSGNPIKEVESILEARGLKPKPLVVVLDGTIDYTHSLKVQHFLEHFSKHFVEGSLVAFVLESGQKFCQFGMDMIYACRYYAIGRKECLVPFEILFQHDAFQTDPLSHQWFCLLTKAVSDPDVYRRAIFQNTRALLNQIPASLLPGANGPIQVSLVADDVDTCFIDIKFYGEQSNMLAIEQQVKLYELFTDKEAILYTRAGYGYFHPNLVKFTHGFDDDVKYTTMRITLGINPQDNQILLALLNNLLSFF